MVGGFSSKKTRSITLLTLTCAFVLAGLILSLPHYNLAHAAGPTLTVTPTSAAYSGTSITVKGSSYGANEAVNVYWNYTGSGTGTLETTATTDSTGAFTTKFKKPLAATGTYTIAGVGQTSNLVATATFLLLPRLLLTPQAGGPGTQLAFQGNAFGNGETIDIYWNYTGPSTGTLLTTASGDSTGSFKVKANVPAGTTPGTIPIVGIGQSSNTTASQSFILYPPTLTLAPLSGSANITLTLSAYGFCGLEKVNIFWNNDASPLLVSTTTAFGYMAPATITVPANTVPGTYPVKAVGQTSGIIITNMFTVVAPGFNLSLASGPVGVSVNITGQGYDPNELVNILWNYSGPGTGTTVATVNAGSSGTIRANFTVPTASPGSYTVAAVGSTSHSIFQNTFTVGNGLASSPATTPPSTGVTVTGTGFQANELVQIHWDSTSGVLLATATADGNGNISQGVTIPANATPGTHSLVGIGQTSGQSFTAPVNVDTSWGDFGFDFAHHRENTYEQTVGPSNATNLNLKWSASTAPPYDGSPVYANGVVYIATDDGYLNAYDAITGTLKWKFNSKTGYQSVSSPLVDPTTGIVFFGTVGQWDPGIPSPVYALDAQTGTLKWSLIIPWDEYGFPTLAFNTIYIGCAREAGVSSLLALDEVSGRVIWQYATKGGVWGAVAADTSTNTVYTGVGNPSDLVVALNATTGAQLWKFSVPFVTADDDPCSGIDVANGMVYVDSKNGSVYALKESDGTLVWSRSIAKPGAGNRSSPVVATNGVLYVGSHDKNLYALNASTGAFLWKRSTGAFIDSSPAVANGVVYFASQDKKIYALNATNGAVLWSYTTGGLSYSSPIIVNGWLYCGSTDGKLYAFSL